MLRHQWSGTGRGLRVGHYAAWQCDQVPGVTVRHCGHPTALRPYYVTGLEPLHGRTFARLVETIAAAEAAAALEGIELAEIPRSARPGLRPKLADVHQAALF